MRKTYSKRAVKYINKQDAVSKKVIRNAINKLPDGDVKYFVNDNIYRLRIGNIRVLYSLDGDSIIITDIGPRGDIYEETFINKEGGNIMTALSKDIILMAEQLSEKKQLALLEFLKTMLDDDYISEEDRENIRQAHAEYLRGETVDHEDIDWD